MNLFFQPLSTKPLAIKSLTTKVGLATVLALSLSLGGCSTMSQYTQDYQQARAQHQGVVLSEVQAQQLANRFVLTFNQLGTPTFLSAVKELYASEFFINDTLSQYRQKSSLLKHFEGMNKRVVDSKVTLVQVTYAGDVAYVHWDMRYDLKMFGTVRSMRSYGISELKQNSSNQIIFQQDFWDPANGLYRALPYVGGLYQWFLPFKRSDQ
jgi:hypothetical protein